MSKRYFRQQATVNSSGKWLFDWSETPGPEILEILGGLYAAMEE